VAPYRRPPVQTSSWLTLGAGERVAAGLPRRYGTRNRLPLDDTDQAAGPQPPARPPGLVGGGGRPV